MLSVLIVFVFGGCCCAKDVINFALCSAFVFFVFLFDRCQLQKEELKYIKEKMVVMVNQMHVMEIINDDGEEILDTTADPDIDTPARWCDMFVPMFVLIQISSVIISTEGATDDDVPLTARNIFSYMLIVILHYYMRQTKNSQDYTINTQIKSRLVTMFAFDLVQHILKRDGKGLMVIDFPNPEGAQHPRSKLIKVIPSRNFGDEPLYSMFDRKYNIPSISGDNTNSDNSNNPFELIINRRVINSLQSQLFGLCQNAQNLNYILNFAKSEELLANDKYGKFWFLLQNINVNQNKKSKKNKKRSKKEIDDTKEIFHKKCCIICQ